MRFKLSKGNMSATAPKALHGHSYHSPEMAERNHQVRLFLEDDENSTIRQGSKIINYSKVSLEGRVIKILKVRSMKKRL